jgi:hypothetical protein
MIRILKRCGLAAALVAASLAGGASGSSAANVTVGLPVVGDPGYYDYTPTVIQNGTTIDLWWCGDLPSHIGDTILHAQYSTAGGTASVTEPEQAVFQEPADATAWDHTYVCNPDVVAGKFANPLGNGVTYSYAMYFVGTNNAAALGSQASIGVAFSNDGLSWSPYPTSVITYNPSVPGANPQDYGYAQPNAYNPGGGSAVTLLYQNGLVGNESNSVVTSADGVHFSAPQPITSAGLPSAPPGVGEPKVPGWGGVAYDEENGLWYGTFDYQPPYLTGRTDAETAHVGERGAPGVTLFSTDNLISGAWKQLTTIDTNLTGYEENFLAGLLRQPDGALSDETLPQIELFVSVSNPRPAVTASPAQAAESAVTTNWDIVWSLYNPAASPLRRLDRYYSDSLKVHEVTTGWVDRSAFHDEGPLGTLYEAPTGDATVPWYSCKAGGSNWFVSLDPRCEGQLYIGLEGYGFAHPGDSELPLYRCQTSTDHFVSTNPNCEGGATTEGLLGYAGVSAFPVGAA